MAVCLIGQGEKFNCFGCDLKPDKNVEKGLIVQLSRTPGLGLIKTLP